MALSPVHTWRQTTTTLYKQRLKISLVFLILFLYPASSHLQSTMSATHQDAHLSRYIKSVFIPYMHKFNTQDIPTVQATISGIDFELPMDTGSTGLMIGAPRLPHISPDDGIPAYEYLTSSRILYSGRLVTQSVTFHGKDGTCATATVPILVVDKSMVCPWYKPGVDGFDCPAVPDKPYPELRDTSHITYMGVGFGRNRLGDNKAKALPSANPFLNIRAVNGEVLRVGALRPGYTISTEGVHLGLTKENTRGFDFTSLGPGVTHDADPRDWAMVNMCFRCDGQGNNCGSALIDTGIPQMYLRTNVGVETPNVTVRNPNKNGDAEWVKRVKPGTKIEIGFPTLNEGVAGYSFQVGGQGSRGEPSYVVPEQQSPPAYVNTGRNFLLAFSVAFDAVAGRFGFQAVPPPMSHSSL